MRKSKDKVAANESMIAVKKRREELEDKVFIWLRREEQSVEELPIAVKKQWRETKGSVFKTFKRELLMYLNLKLLQQIKAGHDLRKCLSFDDNNSNYQVPNYK